VAASVAREEHDPADRGDDQHRDQAREATTGHL
jgi:hypothetical protein